MDQLNTTLGARSQTFIDMKDAIKQEERRKEIEQRLGVPMPDEEKPLPEDVEEELSKVTAEAAEKLLRQNNAEMEKMEAERQEKDPLTQIQRKELQIKETELMHKINMDKAKLELEKLKSDTNRDLQEERIKSENKREGARLSVDMAKESNKAKKAGVDAIINLAKNTGS